LNFIQILLQLSRTDLSMRSQQSALSANNWLSKLQKTFSTRSEGLNKARGWFSKPNCA